MALRTKGTAIVAEWRDRLRGDKTANLGETTYTAREQLLPELRGESDRLVTWYERQIRTEAA